MTTSYNKLYKNYLKWYGQVYHWPAGFLYPAAATNSQGDFLCLSWVVSQLPIFKFPWAQSLKKDFFPPQG